MKAFADTLARREPMGAIWGRSCLPAIVGLALPMAMLTATQGIGVWARFAVVLVVTIGLQVLFARVRKHPLDFGGFVTAGIVAILVPAEAPLYQLLLGTVFGVVIGEQVFGGRGRSFLHPAVVTIAFLTFSFADQDYRTGPAFDSWTLIPALILMTATGQASLRILAAATGALVAFSFMQGSAEYWSLMLSGPIVLTLIYLAADPVSSAATNPGRWAYGILIGALAALFGTVGPAFGATLFAVLLGSIFAPLIDRVVIAIHANWRERRNG